MIVQVQDADLNSVDSASYGDGSATPSEGSGFTTLGNTGLYEFAVVVSATSSTITLDRTLTNTYRAAGAQERFQIVAVVNCLGATLVGDVFCEPWNGSAGGVLALNIDGGTFDMGGFRLDCSDKGLRGGATLSQAGNSATSSYVMIQTTGKDDCEYKGESVAGSPQEMFQASLGSIVSTGIVGYPGGDICKGAPANGGGGGNARESGGGGGANIGRGGNGGFTRSDTDDGGRGGDSLPTDTSIMCMGKIFV